MDEFDLDALIRDVIRTAAIQVDNATCVVAKQLALGGMFLALWIMPRHHPMEQRLRATLYLYKDGFYDVPNPRPKYKWDE